MRALFEEWGISCSSEQEAQFEMVYQMLVETNKQFNLTAITDRTEVYVKHFLDSLVLLKLGVPLSGKRLIDVGTGAGFPLIPLKIMLPAEQMTGMDALNKRIVYLKTLSEALGMESLMLVHGRAEDVARKKNHREAYDVVVSRAVAELRCLLEYAMPFVRPGGHFYAYKSLKGRTELSEAHHALKVLKASLVDSVRFDLPLSSGTRDILIIEKLGTLDHRYPRKAGLPKKQPL